MKIKWIHVEDEVPSNTSSHNVILQMNDESLEAGYGSFNGAQWMVAWTRNNHTEVERSSNRVRYWSDTCEIDPVDVPTFHELAEIRRRKP